MDQASLDQAEWKDARNWHGGWLGLYHSARDSHTWVPKRRPGFGWTVNTARPAAIRLLLGIPVLAAALAGFLRRRAR